MNWLNKGLCLCSILLSLAACSQDKKLPQGTRLSVLEDYDAENIATEQKKISSFLAIFS